MYRSIQVALALVVAVSTTPVLAAEFNYNYVEAGWIQSKINSPESATADGAGVSGSAALGANAHAYADYGYEGFDHGLRIQTYEIGGGFNRTVGTGLDLLGQASYVRDEITGTVNGSNLTGNGWSVSMLLRYRLIDHLEVDGGVKYIDVSEAGSATRLAINAVYSLTKSLYAVAGVDLGNGGHTAHVGFRYGFGG